MEKSGGQKKLNSRQVRNGIFKFILSFVILLTVCIATVFLFFKSSQAQAAGILQKVDTYDQTSMRNQMILEKLNGIYDKLALLGKSQVQNEQVLKSSIRQEMETVRDMIKAGGGNDFREYEILLNQIPAFLSIKNTVGANNMELKNLKAQLDACQSKYGNVVKYIGKQRK